MQLAPAPLVAPPPAGAPSVVLLHGLAANATLNWSGAFPVLAESYGVVAPDLRGHGTARGAKARFTLEDATDDVAALVNELALGPCVVVGYSMGGAIAQLLWRRHRRLVRALVLCATSRIFHGSARERLLFSALPAARLLARALPPEVARAAAQQLGALVVGRPVRGEVAEHAGAFDVPQVLEACIALERYRSHDWIGGVDVPTAVLVHVRDQLVPPARQFALAHSICGARIHPIDGDHFAAVKAARAFATTLAAAVRDVDRRSRHAGSDDVASSAWTAA